ncbi:MAG: phosphoribosylamine--glycine ligase, partial [Deltaproteobacteria bacterium]|nr:phosphoribosylamine--glycine ligase [Deltaproteobacteria bacterium]
RAIIDGRLDRMEIVFEKKATVCKYVVPKGYGLPQDHPGAAYTSSRIEIGEAHEARLYYSSIDQRPDGLYMTSSRAIGVVGIADTLDEAECIAERAVGAIRGSVDHRPDIGTDLLIRKRVQHMKILKGEPI